MLPNQAAPAAKPASRISETALLRMRRPHVRTYHSVAFANTRLNQSKNVVSGPREEVFGRSNKAANAGLNDSALNADRITEKAIVTANCW